jgi:hypothetical protein
MGGRYVGYRGTNASPGGGGRESGGVIPDTMDDDSNWVVQKIKELYDPSRTDPANDPTLAPYLEALKREMSEDMDEQLNSIGDEAAGVNMYGSSGLNLQKARTREEGMEAYGSAAAGMLRDSRESALNRQMQGLGTASGRDLAAMQDKTQRYGIDRSAEAQMASASAGASSNQEIAEKQLKLQAILGMQGMDQFGLQQLGGLGNALTSSQEWAAGSVPGLEASSRGDLETAYGMAHGNDELRSGSQIANRGLGLQASAARNAITNQQLMMEYQNQREQILAPGADMDDYFKRLMGVAGGYGSTQNTNNQRQPSMYGGGFYQQNGRGNSGGGAGNGIGGGGWDDMYTGPKV